jgi:hypothetical protein
MLRRWAAWSGVVKGRTAASSGDRIVLLWILASFTHLAAPLLPPNGALYDTGSQRGFLFFAGFPLENATGPFRHPAARAIDSLASSVWADDGKTVLRSA